MQVYGWETLFHKKSWPLTFYAFYVVLCLAVSPHISLVARGGAGQEAGAASSPLPWQYWGTALQWAAAPPTLFSAHRGTKIHVLVF